MREISSSALPTFSQHTTRNTHTAHCPNYFFFFFDFFFTPAEGVDTGDTGLATSGIVGVCPLDCAEAEGAGKDGAGGGGRLRFCIFCIKDWLRASNRLRNIEE